MRAKTVFWGWLALALIAPLGVAESADKKKAPRMTPPKAATPRSAEVVAVVPLSLAPCGVIGTVKYDAAFKTQAPLVERYVGSMTFTTSFNLRAVNIYTMNYNPGGYNYFLGDCDCPQCPKGSDDPANAPPNTNFKAGESRTYQLSCSWQTGGIPPSGTYRFEVRMAYYLDFGSGWKKGQYLCGLLNVVK
jgi:hypothetical protein